MNIIKRIVTGPWVPKEQGKMPYFWILSLGFFLWKYLYVAIHMQELVLLVLTIAVFVPVYFFNYWADNRQSVLCILLTCLFGVLWTPHNVGVANLFIFACAMCSRLEPARNAYRMVAVVVAIAIASSLWLTTEHIIFMLPVVAVGIPVTVASIMDRSLKQSHAALLRKQEEVEHIARIAERERISRDLHDLLGHSLSMIALKAELAGKLLERDGAACRNEINDIADAARKALSEVRAAVTGYRQSGLPGALASARASLAAANVALHEDVQRLQLAPAEEHVLALAVCEAVTNVVRHAGATHCRLALAREDGMAVLRVADDGICTTHKIEHGNGLTGMRERATAAGGSLSITSGPGLALELRVPMGEAA
jgi:two-component system, NarL family, sensor histidine kinase DesK